MAFERTLKMGMVGGGPDAFIGDVHRKAARLDGKIEIAAGAFDVDPAKSRQMGEQLCLDPGRAYDTYQDMIKGEMARPEGERIDFVSICVPNNLHFPIAKDFIEAGFNVMCEKPMTITLDEAKELEKLVEKHGVVFGLMHNYTGYPMVKLARDLVAGGDFGKVRKVVVRYIQGWLATKLEDTGLQQATWRTDPKQSGAGCLGDIATHAENLAEYITGLKIENICADITSFVPGRPVDDDVNCLLRFEDGVKGILHATQIATGQENGLSIWVHGENKTIEWHQEEPNALYLKDNEGPMQVWRRGNPYVEEVSAAAARGCRIPPGHPEAFIEAMANVYCNFADTIWAKLEGQEADALVSDFPKVGDGVRGMSFIETVMESAKSDQKWTAMKK
ncbi:putative oxidoreductase YdgJ [Anaerohalosphaera lusitana]|uniref:Putative oxidoreductase YdgJ n=1 Tax=Anaerohalosphaera lusitana TaxID=1936003 RepID=A0A1U9NMY7_9BACT|nr:Gfo/Idh/MocA family oxidoreductase [Anaerohalosphaera lusitana]AQT69281.1 putative oxidoreductase YdgJ [Anaerohalosphaera lusitana]